MLLIILIFVIGVACIIAATNKHFKSLEEQTPEIHIESQKVASHEPIVDVPVEKAALQIADNIVKPKVKKPTPPPTKILREGENPNKKKKQITNKGTKTKNKK